MWLVWLVVMIHCGAEPLQPIEGRFEIDDLSYGSYQPYKIGPIEDDFELVTNLDDVLDQWNLPSTWDTLKEGIRCYILHQENFEVHHGQWTVASWHPLDGCQFLFFNFRPSLFEVEGVLLQVGNEISEVGFGQPQMDQKEFRVKVNHSSYKAVGDGIEFGSQSIVHPMLVDCAADISIIDYAYLPKDVPRVLCMMRTRPDQILVAFPMEVYSIETTELMSSGRSTVNNEFDPPLRSVVGHPLRPLHVGSLLGLDTILQAKVTRFECGGQTKFFWNESPPVIEGPRLRSNVVLIQYINGVPQLFENGRFFVQFDGPSEPTLIDSGSEVSRIPFYPGMQATDERVLVTPYGVQNVTLYRHVFTILGQNYESESVAVVPDAKGRAHVLGRDILNQLRSEIRANQKHAQFFIFSMCK